MSGNIRIRRVKVTECTADAIVNPANNKLRRGSGVCGEIFREAGSEQLTAACAAIGSCDVGEAVITPAFRLKAKYIIHTVGPVWHGGFHHEMQKLYCCYGKSLLTAQEHHCHSVVFPLLLTGSFNIPAAKAWKVAVEACRNYLDESGDYEMDICFAVPDRDQYEAGYKELGARQEENVILFSRDDENYGFLTNSFPCRFEIEGVEYISAEQYICSRKALMFRDLEAYAKIMDAADAETCTKISSVITGYNETRWNKYAEQVVYNAVNAKFRQDDYLMKKLRQTGGMTLADHDDNHVPDHMFDAGEKADEHNLLGRTLMKVRSEVSDL